MSDSLVIAAVVAGFVGLMGGAIFLAVWIDKKRTAAMDAFAESHGFTPDPDVQRFQQSMELYKLFNQGHSRKVKRLYRTVRGDDQIAICDDQYTTGSGKQSHTHQQTLCVVSSPKLKTPHFFLRRQIALFDFLGKMFGGQDVNFDEDPPFSKAFVLQTVDGEQALRSRFDARVRGHFTELANRTLHVEAFDGALMLHYGRQLKTDELPQLIDDARALTRTLN